MDVNLIHLLVTSMVNFDEHENNDGLCESRSNRRRNRVNTADGNAKGRLAFTLAITCQSNLFKEWFSHIKRAQTKRIYPSSAESNQQQCSIKQTGDKNWRSDHTVQWFCYHCVLRPWRLKIVTTQNNSSHSSHRTKRRIDRFEDFSVEYPVRVISVAVV